MELTISFIIPVYNRPEEIKELLESFTLQSIKLGYEIVIVEDGSSVSSKDIVDGFSEKLNINYLIKENSGPGDSRNYGMRKAKGNYFIILDSDCILPKNYLENVLKNLQANYADCFGGPDSAHESFSNLQKAINFSMTSFLTTGGIRGKNRSVDTFQPRSFNMGISKGAFLASGGFGTIHPGEDPDLSIRLNQLGYRPVLYPDVVVYHKRRISWKKFYKQVYKFGMVRAILNHWYPKTRRITYWFPSIFIMGFVLALFMSIVGNFWFVAIYGLYFTLAFILSLADSKNLLVALQSLLAIIVQFFGYGYGFLKSTLTMMLIERDPKKAFPELFFEIP